MYMYIYIYIHISLISPLYLLCVQIINRATLGSAFFCTSDYQNGKENDNQCIKCEYQDEDADSNLTSFGIIKIMYYHQLCHSTPACVIICANWYDGEEDDTSRSGLRQVRYNPNFESENMAMLVNCEPVSLVLWPTQRYVFDFDQESSWKNPITALSVLYR